MSSHYTPVEIQIWVQPPIPVTGMGFGPIEISLLKTLTQSTRLNASTPAQLYTA